MNSLTKLAKNTIHLHKVDFTTPAPANTCSGLLLFKVITTQAQVSTKTTATLIMSQLTASLGQILEESGGNFIVFHKKVCSKICIVQSYGTPVGKEALIPRLLITYKKLDRDGNEFTRNVELKQFYVEILLGSTATALSSDKALLQLVFPR
jgi:hypothetical protein